MTRIWTTLCLLALSIVTPASGASAGAPGAGPTVLITGSNRGIGLEFARQYAARGWQVIATTRRPAEATELRGLRGQYPNLVIEQLDITSDTDVAALAARYRGKPIDVLINNAALLEKPASQTLGQLDFPIFARSFDVNATGPMRVTQAFLANVEAGTQKKVIALSSAAGSHGLLAPPANYYAYRASKAALNVLMHNLALDLAPRGIVVGIVNPGLVDTRGVMQLQPGDEPPEEFAALMPLIRAGKITLITPTESVRAMLKLIDGLSAAQSGAFLNYDGQPLPW